MTFTQAKSASSILLNEVASISTGYHLRRKQNHIPSGNISIIQMSDIQGDGTLDYQGFTRLSLKKIKTDYLVERGDVLVTNRGSENEAVSITEQVKDTIAASHFYRIRPDLSVLSSEFLSWYINQPPAQRLLSRYKKASSITLLSREGLENLTVPVLPLSTQQIVAQAGALSRKEQELETRLAHERFKLVTGKLLEQISLDIKGATNA